MLKLFIRDNTDGAIHEYGTNPHDSLELQEDGSLHYVNMQNYGSTYGDSYTFVSETGIDPRTDEDLLRHGVEPILDIAGEYYNDKKLQRKVKRDRKKLNRKIKKLIKQGNYVKKGNGMFIGENVKEKYGESDEK